MHLVRILSGPTLVSAAQAETSTEAIKWARENLRPGLIVDVDGERYSYEEFERALQSMGFDNS